ncbi:MAG: bifunctional glutamate N-acetyltransferase/amino-acid acetyltransferase ArgJ [Chloroflexi bacterium]|nr:bifunctional glutamate N-acetyltransferase/amino-acid acetyltransferase ArgJ [Chloroflexota bacterium]
MFTTIDDGQVTSPTGFKAGTAAAGIKYPGRCDLGLLVSAVPAVAAGVFTRNPVRSAPVQVSQQRVARGSASAVAVNTGCSNACTGERGVRDAELMAAMAAAGLGLHADDVLVASTGVIGTFLPLDRIEAGLGKIVLHEANGHAFARAIMTTDTRPKEIAVAVDGPYGRVVIGAAAKGSGMIHPNMGTMLCFVTTDACVDPVFLQAALVRSVDPTLNMVSVDGDTSPSDTVFLLANGLAGNELIGEESGHSFEEALAFVCEYMAKAIAADGEGASKLIEVAVVGARSIADARTAARTVASSPLVKAAIHGADPNWGRIVCAVGRSGAAVDPLRVSLSLNGVPVMSRGEPLVFSEADLRESMKSTTVEVLVGLDLGSAAATAWGCDLSPDYVTINASYTS